MKTLEVFIIKNPFKLLSSVGPALDESYKSRN
jgi:hypothetical protein